MQSAHLEVTGLAGHATVTVVGCVAGVHVPLTSLIVSPERVAELAQTFAEIAHGDDPDLPIPFELTRPPRLVRVYRVVDLWTYDCREHAIWRSWHNHSDAYAAAVRHVEEHHQVEVGGPRG